MKNIVYILLLLVGSINAQEDSLKNDTLSCHFYEIDVSTRNVWRGIDFGNYSPTLTGVVGISPLEGLEFGAVCIVTLTGTQLGYGNTFNIYASYSKKNITIELDDYYFQGHFTNIRTDYTNWYKTHFLEGRIRYDYKDFYIFTGYTINGGDLYNIKNSQFNNTNAFYLEVGYENDDIGLSIGGINGPSALNFHDKEGITNIRCKYMNDIRGFKNLPFEVGLVYNPSFKYIAPYDIERIGYGRTAFNFYVTLKFK